VEYRWTGGDCERRGEVRKWMDVPLHFASKVMNLAQSGKKCEVAPEFMIVLPHPTWTEVADANV
jgi:hypothetical protein